ncbi:hypothetical protein M9Y10_013818 [Tritrichomonas musculus]|uniref:Uncharacterized protein n=1 Tax=Tritrichomonas musculus TaxID=1915356 RepID=A0ABR2KYD8_9EUKA
MGFKNFITNGWNRLKSDVQQGITGAKNVAHRVWNATKKGLIGAKNFAMNNPPAVGTVLHAISPFATAFNPTLGALTTAGANIFSHMPKGSVTDKLVKISEQFARGELTPGGSSSAQAAADLRKRTNKKPHNAIPFRGL